MLEDSYILLESFNDDDIERFMVDYIKDFDNQSDHYEYPSYGDLTEFETDSFIEMLHFILDKRGREYRFYFRNNNQQSAIKRGMIFFNEDKSVTLGISIPTEFAEAYEDQLKKDFHTPYSMICTDTYLPPGNAQEFKASSRQHFG